MKTVNSFFFFFKMKHCPFQMLRKSVETRDWLNTIEPRNVRAVMKRVVEDMTAIDLQVSIDC